MFESKIDVSNICRVRMFSEVHTLVKVIYAALFDLKIFITANVKGDPLSSIAAIATSVLCLYF